MERQTWFNLWYVIFAVLGVVWLRDIYVTATQVKPVPYSEFEKELKAGEIKDIAISNNVIQGTYKNPRPDNHTRFVTTRVDPDLAKELSQYNVEYSGVIESTFLRDILSFVAPALIFFGIWMFLAKRMAGQGGLGGVADPAGTGHGDAGPLTADGGHQAEQQGLAARPADHRVRVGGQSAPGPVGGGRLAQRGVPGDRAVGVAPGRPGQRGAQRPVRGQARLAERQRQHRLAAATPGVQGLVGGERGRDGDAGQAQPGMPGVRVRVGEGKG